MQLSVTKSVTQQDLDEVRLGLNTFGVFIIKKDESGKKLAGLTGPTYGNWLRIEMLWVSDKLRGQQLIKVVEEEARARGCRYTQVDTASFQARPFYEKLGYTLRFSLDHYLSKTL